MRILYESIIDIDEKNLVKTVNVDDIADKIGELNPDFKIYETSPTGISILLGEAPVLFISHKNGQVTIRDNQGRYTPANVNTYLQIIFDVLSNYRM